MPPELDARLLELVDWLHAPAMESLVLLALITHAAAALSARTQRSRVPAARVGFGIFLVWLLLAVATGGLADAPHLVAVSIRGFLLAVIATGVLAILFRAAEATLGWFNRAIRQPVRSWRTARRQRLSREQERQTGIGGQLAESPQTARQRQQRDAEELERARELRRDREQRDAQRFELQVLYERHRIGLMDVLPETRFQDMLETWLGDDVTPGEFRQRADQLQQLIRERIGPTAIQPQKSFASLEDVITHYQAHEATIRGLTVDEDVRDTLLASLNQLRDRALQEMLK